jgi:hypothetical protein
VVNFASPRSTGRIRPALRLLRLCRRRRGPQLQLLQLRLQLLLLGLLLRLLLLLLSDRVDRRLLLRRRHRDARRLPLLQLLPLQLALELQHPPLQAAHAAQDVDPRRV